MCFGQVTHMDVIPDGGAVGSGIIRPVDFEV